MFSIAAERSLLEASFLDLKLLTIDAPDGTRFERVVVRHPGAVAVVAVHEGDVLLIRQYRAPIDDVILEIPAGKLDVPGEDHAVAAVRELEEEIGFTARRVDHVVSFFTGPGFTDEVIHLYRATDLEPVPPRPHGVEEEVAEVVHVPLGEVAAMIADGRIRDAKTILALQAALLARP
jgi:ADP-ribose pyrophosphatase